MQKHGRTWNWSIEQAMAGNMSDELVGRTRYSLTFCIERGHCMKTLQVAIEEREFIRFGLTREQLSFAELVEAIRWAYAREAVAKCHRLAKAVGLSQMTLADINAEIRAVRDHADTHYEQVEIISPRNYWEHHGKFFQRY